MAAKTYDATNTASVREFARDVDIFGSPEFAEWLTDQGLMNVEIEPEFEAARKIFDMSLGAWLSFCMVVEIDSTGKDDMLCNFFGGVVEHIISGHDTEQADSVGGYSQREIDLIANYMSETI